MFYQSASMFLKLAPRSSDCFMRQCRNANDTRRCKSLVLQVLRPRTVTGTAWGRKSWLCKELQRHLSFAFGNRWLVTMGCRSAMLHHSWDITKELPGVSALHHNRQKDESRPLTMRTMTV